jgi:hypothetical protein
MLRENLYFYECAAQIFYLRPETKDCFARGRFRLLEIVVGEESPVVVGLKPLVEVDLI